MRINICSIGDPRSPKTWSGTVLNIVEELDKRGKLGAVFRVDNNFLSQIIVPGVSMAYYGTWIDRNRGKFVRHFNGLRVVRKTSISNTPITLHVGTCNLPVSGIPKGQCHYLYCDSTWNLWSSRATNMGKYSKRLIEDAERIERSFYTKLQHIFTVSEYVKKNLIDHYHVHPSKITQVGTGTGIIQPYYGEKNFENGKILFAAKGRFKDKGGDIVIEAFKMALKRKPDLKLTIVGQSEYKESIEDPNIKTYGFIPRDELQALFNDHSLFLMPALNEPWGLVYIEALSCQMPIVGLNRNSFPQLSGYGKYGFGIDEASPEVLADEIVKAFSDIDKLRAKGLAGQAFSNVFSWKNTVDKILAQIDNDTKA